MTTPESMTEALNDAAATSARRGRPATATTPVEPLPDLPGAVTASIEATRTVATTLAEAVTAQQMTLAEGFGMARAFDFMSRFTGLARTKWLAERKESGDYKGLSMPNAQGQLVELRTFEDLCEVLGVSRSKADEDIKNLMLLGEEFLEASQRLGLGYRQLRQLRALPDDARQLVIEGEAVKESDPEALKDLLEELAARNATVRKEKDDLAADLAARDKVLATKNKALDEAQTELAKLTSLPPDKRLELEMEREANARKELDAALHGFVGAAVQGLAVARAVLENREANAATCAYMHEAWSNVCLRLADLLHENSIDVDFRQVVYPKWQGDVDGKRGDATGDDSAE
ncbi:hypothetical protein [Nitratidesulfovibrio liaohensis]|uniref:hypothetical protein n=1 Tax=Nitratidesulfovibrio liaohensis TaxID=2604158 RepID=UPI00141EC3BA|nr:hypothetical protein [Nitratidesulfovibrio liaohensis]NHZ48619.1 hypothetical protein [Nitratidesulfovibrio liaohensis]